MSFKGEYLKAKEAGVKREGWYAQLGYYLPLLPKVQGVVKYEEFEDINNDEGRDLTIGLNYFIRQNRLKLQLDFIHRDGTIEDNDNDMILSALQVTF